MSIKAMPAWNINDMPATSLRTQREHDLETRGLDAVVLHMPYLDAENWNARKALDVAFKELVDSVQSDDSKMSVLMSIL